MAVLAAITGLSGAFVGVAVANHQWSDVPESNFFHDSITNFTDAGCASGYPDGTFRPTEPVLRQQMARFVNSCGGRLWFDSAESVTVTTSDTSVATAEMVSGAVGDGTGRVLVNVSARVASNSTTGFPCEVKVQLGSGGSARFVYLDLPANTSDAIEDAAGSIQQSFLLAAGFNSVQQVTVGKNASCTAAVFADIAVSATYWPFSASGGGAEAIASDSASSLPRP